MGSSFGGFVIEFTSITRMGSRMGVMQALGWEKLYNAGDPELVVAPPPSFRKSWR